MIEPPEDRRPPLTPQLALRVAIVGSVALALFAIIFFRLWFLQVLSGDQYLAQAKVNRVRNVGIQAERGDIVDRVGQVLVNSRRARAVQISPPSLPKSGHARSALYRHLAGVLNVSTKPSRCVIAGKPPKIRRLAPIPCKVAQQLAILPYADITIKTDVSSRRPVLPRRALQPVPLGRGPADLPAQLPAEHAGRPAVRDGRADQPRRGQAEGLPGHLQERDHRPVRPGGGLRPVPAGHRRHRAGTGQRVRRADRQPHHRQAPSPATTWRCRSTPGCRRSARARSSSRSTPTTRPTAERSWR